MAVQKIPQKWRDINPRAAFLENPGIAINIEFSLLVASLVCWSIKYIHTSSKVNNLKKSVLVTSKFIITRNDIFELNNQETNCYKNHHIYLLEGQYSIVLFCISFSSFRVYFTTFGHKLPPPPSMFCKY